MITIKGTIINEKLIHSIQIMYLGGVLGNMRSSPDKEFYITDFDPETTVITDGLFLVLNGTTKIPYGQGSVLLRDVISDIERLTSIMTLNEMDL